MNSHDLIRINFEGFWPGFGLLEFCQIFRSLLWNYEFELSDQPDVVLSSVFRPDGDLLSGHRKWPNAKQVYYTGENKIPPLDLFDGCISFYRDINDRRHLRLPYFIPQMHGMGFSMQNLKKFEKRNTHSEHTRNRFCTFVASNPNNLIRNNFTKLLSKYSHVDCPGKVLNNMPSDVIGPAGDYLRKHSFYKNYKYVICFENISTKNNEGYVTEKITDAMLSGCIPIYWGDHRVSEDFNSKSFIDLTQFDQDINSMAEHVIKIDQDQNYRHDIISQPWLINNTIPDHLNDFNLLRFFNQLIK